MVVKIRSFFLPAVAVVLCGSVAGVVFAQRGQEQVVTVKKVYDGDTFVADNGTVVRLVGINAPESCGSYRGCEPYGDTAKIFAQNWLTGQKVTLKPQRNAYDRYDRLLADVYLQDGTWVNGEMVRRGHAHVYTFPENALYIDDLLMLERQARQAKQGLWEEPRWQPRLADLCCNKVDIGKLVIVEGVVKQVTKVKDTTYFNFGDDWTTDFSLAMNETARRRFLAKGIDPKTYEGKKIRVRGVAKPVNGVLITLTHPEQLELLYR